MYVTAQEIAALIEERREMTHKEIANEIDPGGSPGASAVSQALANPSSRRLSTLAEIAKVHGIEVDTKVPMYQANVKKDEG